MNPGMMGGMMNPGMMNPGMMNPGMMNPGMMNPGMMNQGMMNNGMMMPGMMMPGMMQGMVGGGAQMNNDEQEEWMKGFKMAQQESTAADVSEQNAPGPKMNIVFNTTQGTTHNMVLPYGTTIGQALEKYLQRVGRPDLIGNQENKICFLVNAQKLKFGDTTPIEQFFKNSINPKVVVNDINNLIGA